MVGLSDRDLQLPNVEFPDILKKIANDSSIISLGPGEPDFVTPKPILDYAKKIIGKSTHYSEPLGLLELREKLCKKLEKENKIKASPENIFVGCGSQEAMFSTLLTTLDPKEQIIIPSPGYLGYLPAVELVSAVPVFLKLDEEEDFEINPDRLKKLINKKKTKAIIVNSPSNPTGNVLSKKVLEEIADIAIDNNLYVFSDEAYEKITYGKKHISMASLNGMEKNVVTFQTFSKTSAMCGFRVGYAVGPKKLIKEASEVHNYVSISSPTLSQMMAVKALKLPNKYLKDMNKEYKRRRDFIVGELNNLELPTCVPAGAFYAFSNISKYGKNSSRFAEKLLKEAKVAVIPGTEFGPHGEGFVRFSFATDYNLIVKAIKRMKKVLS